MKIAPITPRPRVLRRRADGARLAVGQRLRFRVLERCGFACSYCGRRPPEVALQIDHVLPVSLGGTNDEDNLVAACWDCNIGKGDTLLARLEPTPDPEMVAAERPAARVRLQRGKACWYWVVERCPFCGRQHTHGGGPLDGDPRRLLGHRSQHCVEGPLWPKDGYRLVEVPR